MLLYARPVITCHRVACRIARLGGLANAHHCHTDVINGPNAVVAVWHLTGF
jgi:hypothetical protein